MDSAGEEIEKCETALQRLKNLPSGSLTHAQMELERSSKFALVGFYNMRCMRNEARVIAEELLKQAISLKDVEFEIAIRSVLGHNYYMKGLYRQAKETLETAIAMYEPKEHQGLAVKYSLELEPYCRMTLALVLWRLGYADQAVTEAKYAHQRALEIGHTASVAMANVYLAYIGYFRKEPDFILEVCEDNKKMCERYPDMAWCTSFLTCLEEWANNSTQHTDPFIAQKRAENELFAMSFYEARLAETKIKLGHVEQALALLSESINWCHKTGETIALSTLYRIQAKGYLASAEYNTEAVVNALKTALNIAQKQQSIALELDACVDLCQFYKRDKHQHKVRELLAPLLAQFSEGFETKIFKEASLLLAECSENHEYTASHVGLPVAKCDISKLGQCGHHYSEAPRLIKQSFHRDDINAF